MKLKCLKGYMRLKVLEWLERLYWVKSVEMVKEVILG
jgi:hypothetical protein